MTLSLTFSKSFFEQNVSLQLKITVILSDFERFLSFRNKARNAGCSHTNAGMREISQNAGFPARLRDG